MKSQQSSSSSRKRRVMDMDPPHALADVCKRIYRREGGVSHETFGELARELRGLSRERCREYCEFVCIALFKFLPSDPGLNEPFTSNALVWERCFRALNVLARRCGESVFSSRADLFHPVAIRCLTALTPPDVFGTTTTTSTLHQHSYELGDLSESLKVEVLRLVSACLTRDDSLDEDVDDDDDDTDDVLDREIFNSSTTWSHGPLNKEEDAAGYLALRLIKIAAFDRARPVRLAALSALRKLEACLDLDLLQRILPGICTSLTDILVAGDFKTGSRVVAAALASLETLVLRTMSGEEVDENEQDAEEMLRRLLESASVGSTVSNDGSSSTRRGEENLDDDGEHDDDEDESATRVGAAIVRILSFSKPHEFASLHICVRLRRVLFSSRCLLSCHLRFGRAARLGARKGEEHPYPHGKSSEMFSDRLGLRSSTLSSPSANAALLTTLILGMGDEDENVRRESLDGWTAFRSAVGSTLLEGEVFPFLERFLRDAILHVERMDALTEESAWRAHGEAGARVVEMLGFERTRSAVASLGPTRVLTSLLRCLDLDLSQWGQHRRVFATEVTTPTTLVGGGTTEVEEDFVDDYQGLSFTRLPTGGGLAMEGVKRFARTLGFAARDLLQEPLLRVLGAWGEDEEWSLSTRNFPSALLLLPEISHFYEEEGGDDEERRRALHIAMIRSVLRFLVDEFLPSLRTRAAEGVIGIKLNGAIRTCLLICVGGLSRTMRVGSSTSTTWWFRSRLVEALFPILEGLGDPDATVAYHAEEALRRVARLGCGYRDASELLRENLDLVVSALLDRLPSSWALLTSSPDSSSSVSDAYLASVTEALLSRAGDWHDTTLLADDLLTGVLESLERVESDGRLAWSLMRVLAVIVPRLVPKVDGQPEENAELEDEANATQQPHDVYVNRVLGEISLSRFEGGDDIDSGTPPGAENDGGEIAEDETSQEAMIEGSKIVKVLRRCGNYFIHPDVHVRNQAMAVAAACFRGLAQSPARIKANVLRPAIHDVWRLLSDQARRETDPSTQVFECVVTALLATGKGDDFLTPRFSEEILPVMVKHLTNVTTTTEARFLRGGEVGDDDDDERAHLHLMVLSAPTKSSRAASFSSAMLRNLATIARYVPHHLAPLDNARKVCEATSSWIISLAREEASGLRTTETDEYGRSVVLSSGRGEGRDPASCALQIWRSLVRVNGDVVYANLVRIMEKVDDARRTSVVVELLTSLKCQ